MCFHHEDEAWQNEIQLTAYHLLMADATGEAPGPGELVYLAKLKTPKVISQTLPPVDATRIGRFAALAERYVEGDSREEHYPSPGMACRWCSFRGQCKGLKGGGQEGASIRGQLNRTVISEVFDF